MDPQRVVATLLPLLSSATRSALSADGLEEPRDILALFEGFAFAAQYLREKGADEAVVAETVAVLRMLPKEEWEPSDKFQPLRPVAAVMLSEVFQPPSREAFPPAPRCSPF